MYTYRRVDLALAWAVRLFSLCRVSLEALSSRMKSYCIGQQTWYAKTPLGKKRAKAAAGDDEGDKKGKKGKKGGKKSGKKKKKWRGTGVRVTTWLYSTNPNTLFMCI